MGLTLGEYAWMQRVPLGYCYDRAESGARLGRDCPCSIVL